MAAHAQMALMLVVALVEVDNGNVTAGLEQTVKETLAAITLLRVTVLVLVAVEPGRQEP